jgi:hypothetical protein
MQPHQLLHNHQVQLGITNYAPFCFAGIDLKMRIKQFLQEDDNVSKHGHNQSYGEATFSRGSGSGQNLTQFCFPHNK